MQSQEKIGTLGTIFVTDTTDEELKEKWPKLTEKWGKDIN